MNPKTRLGIIRGSREQKSVIWQSISYMNHLGEKRIRARVLGCSATIKKLEIKARFLERMWVHRAIKESNDSSELKEIMKDHKRKNGEANMN